MESKQPPKVFISHSSSDKKRFVESFAKKLTQSGLDPWFDYWEIKPGDSLVDKIFEEGIKHSKSFIIILSKNSIKSKWVREELNTAVINRINNQTKIIPVLIDKVKVPEVLKATAWVKINDLGDFDREVKEIANSILGLTKKPETINHPIYDIELYEISDLSKIDSLILKILVEHILDNKINNQLLTPTNIFPKCEKYGLEEKEIEESLEILRNEFYINIDLTNLGYLGSPCMVNDYAILEYCKYYFQDFEKKVKEIVSLIINKEMQHSSLISEETSVSEIIVCSLIKDWKESNYFRYITNMYPHIHIGELTASGKRYFRSLLE